MAEETRKTEEKDQTIRNQIHNVKYHANHYHFSLQLNTTRKLLTTSTAF
jgi:hypothetical protein